ncbi:MAG: MotA/TolQ/ExbB proton channel family protein [Proteobacteria bacterium]|nr:MAG: MotA/TolQ/ExbB proton channel family protein [Pseudomonadota bacterium]
MPEVVASLARWPAEILTDLIDQGGPFVIAIFLCGFVMWTLVFERWWYFAQVLPRQQRAALAAWSARSDRRSWCARQIRRAMVSRVHTGMAANQMLLRVLVPLSPLLGLVGTVSGMLEVFDSMALRGAADARSMASGVSHAMICTLTGLAVSITGLYPVYYFQSRTRHETERFADELAY